MIWESNAHKPEVKTLSVITRRWKDNIRSVIKQDVEVRGVTLAGSWQVPVYLKIIQLIYT